MKIILADDHPVVLLGTEAVLAADPRSDFTVVGSARSVATLWEQLHHAPTCVLVTDFSMPSARHADGLTMISRVRREFPHVRILVLSMVTSTHTLRALLRLGVTGLYDKHESLAQLPRAVRMVGLNRRFISPSYQTLLAQPNEALSARELEVVRMLARGLTGRQIAELTHRSEKTVSRHKRAAMAKLGIVHDRALIDFVDGVSVAR